MQLTGLVKRILPFVLTFSAGLLLASIFIPIGLPDFSTWRETRRGKHCREHRDLRNEINRLRDELRVSEMEKEELRLNSSDTIPSVQAVEPPYLMEAPHPPPPRKPKHPRFDHLQ